MGVRRSEKAKKTLGAGDTFMGAFCSMLLYGKATNEALKYGIAASKINIEGEVRRGESVIARELDL